MASNVIMVSNELIPDKSEGICPVDPSLLEHSPHSTTQTNFGVPTPEDGFVQNQLTPPGGQLGSPSLAFDMLPMDKNLWNSSLPAQANLQTSPDSVAMDPALLQPNINNQSSSGFYQMPPNAFNAMSHATTLPTPPSDSGAAAEEKLNSLPEPNKDATAIAEEDNDEEDMDQGSDHSEEKEDSTHKRLRKNRIAARKCRRRKKYANDKLENKERELRAANDELAFHVNELRNELLDLKGEVFRHAACDSEPIDKYLQKEASRMNVETSDFLNFGEEQT